jgi:RNA polymerase sigma factor (sigma-70 family)
MAIITAMIMISMFIHSQAYNSPKYMNYMAKKHHKLVPFYANKQFKYFNVPHYHRKDIIQEGYVGLMYAARKYDKTRNVSFSYYSKYWIDRYVKEAIRKYKKYNSILSFDDSLKNSKITNEDHYKKIEMEILLENLNDYEKALIHERFFKNKMVKDMAKTNNYTRRYMSCKINNILHKLNNYT